MLCDFCEEDEMETQMMAMIRNTMQQQKLFTPLLVHDEELQLAAISTDNQKEGAKVPEHRHGSIRRRQMSKSKTQKRKHWMEEPSSQFGFGTDPRRPWGPDKADRGLINTCKCGSCSYSGGIRRINSSACIPDWDGT